MAPIKHLQNRQVKLLEGGGLGGATVSVAAFLDRAVEPPPAASVANAVRLLQDIGAFKAGTETLTVSAASTLSFPSPFGVVVPQWCGYTGNLLTVGHGHPINWQDGNAAETV